MSIHLHEQPRVEIDPNRHSRRRPDFLPVPLEYTPVGLVEGQRVTAVQSDDLGPDFVGSAKVAEIDVERALIYFDVDWRSFREEVPSAPPATGLRGINFVSHGNARSVFLAYSTSGSEDIHVHQRGALV